MKSLRPCPSPWKNGILAQLVIKGERLIFPWCVDLIVLQHHEKLDGSGYPQGISGEDILLEARILCVADVVETMETHGPYRPSHLFLLRRQCS